MAMEPDGAATAAPLPRAVLFDLDGTLIDSVPDIRDAVAELLGNHGLPPLDEDLIRTLVGRGLRVLVHRAFDAHGVALSETVLDIRYEEMKGIYARHLVGKTTLMPGALDALGFLRERGCRLAIVTNKLSSATETILAHLAIRPCFDAVVGDGPAIHRARLAHKPEPDMLLEALDQLAVPAGDAVMVGDSGFDVLAARAAGVRSIAVRGGYSAVALESFAPDELLTTLADLPALFGG